MLNNKQKILFVITFILLLLLWIFIVMQIYIVHIYVNIIFICVCIPQILESLYYCFIYGIKKSDFKYDNEQGDLHFSGGLELLSLSRLYIIGLGIIVLEFIYEKI